jgi:hypothetical protein
MGPETYNDLGNESYISANRLPKGSGVEHLRDSNITDTGTVVSVNSNTQVTGSLRVTGSLAVVGASTFSSTGTFSGIVGVNGSTEEGWALKSNGNLKIENNNGTTVVQVNDTATGGKTWSLISSGNGNAHSIPAGTFYLRNSSDSLTALSVTSGGNILIGSTSGVSLNSLTNQLSVSSTTYNLFDISRFSDNAFGPNFYLVKSRNGTIGSNTIVANGDNLGNINWVGANGTGFTDAASIKAEVDGTPGASNDMPGRLVFSTTADGSGSATERMRITSAGVVRIGDDSYPYLEIANGGSTDVLSGIRWMVGGSRVNYGGVEMAAPSADNGYMIFKTRNSGTTAERMRIHSGGAVSIKSGTQPTGNGLHFYFNSDISRIESLEANIAWRPLEIRSSQTTLETGGTERMRITSNGTIAFNGNSTPNSGGLDKLSLGFSDGAYGWIQTWGGRPLSLNSQGNNVLIGTTTDAGTGARLQVTSGTTVLTTLIGAENTTTSLSSYNITTSSSTPVTLDINTGRSNALFQISIDAMSYDAGVTHWVTAIGRGYLFPSGFGISTSIISNSGLSASLSYISNSVVRVTITDSVNSNSKSGICRVTVSAKSP